MLHPPVDTEYFHPETVPVDPSYLVVSALVPYKRIEVAIEACRLARRPLRIVGDGPDRDRLERTANGSVQFLGALPDEAVRDLYRRSRAVLLPGVEDFGIVPVEAQACGRPAIGLAHGGTAETILDGTTGVLVAESSAEAFADGIGRLERLALEPSALRQHALAFSRERFVASFARHVDDLMAASEETARW